jgi:endonuclease/exonuclease/phosphatase (EEP) superfamily protein YafD
MSPAAPKIRRGLAARFAALVTLVLLATAASLLAKIHWFAELFTHFAPHYCAISVLSALALWLCGAPRWALVAMALALWNGYPVAAALIQSGYAAYTGPGARLTVFHYNAGLRLAEPTRIVDHLLREDIDVAVLIEATPALEHALDRLKEKFPHQIRHLEESPFGIAAVSRHAFAAASVSREPDGHPHLEIMLRLPERERPIALYAIHPPPPVSRETAMARNTKLAYIARVAAANPGASPIVVGDFNLTPWSPYFREFVVSSGLRDLRTPHRVENTWPVTFGRAWFGLALDHSFAHPSLQPVRRTIGPDLGSDHLPVTVTVAYR